MACRGQGVTLWCVQVSPVVDSRSGSHFVACTGQRVTLWCVQVKGSLCGMYRSVLLLRVMQGVTFVAIAGQGVTVACTGQGVTLWHVQVSPVVEGHAGRHLCGMYRSSGHFVARAGQGVTLWHVQVKGSLCGMCRSVQLPMVRGLLCDVYR